jgi:hypothetical protein
MSKQKQNAIRIKRYAIDNKCSISKAQKDLGFGKYYFNDVIKGITAGKYNCSEEEKTFLYKNYGNRLNINSNTKHESSSKETVTSIKANGYIFTEEEVERKETKVVHSIPVGANTRSIELMAFSELNEESIAKATGYDLNLYKVEVKEIKLYQTAMKLKDDNGVEKAHVVDLYSIKVKVSAKTANYETISIPDWINEIKPVQLNRMFTKSNDGRLLYIPIFDLHFGKRDSDGSVRTDWVDKVMSIINKSLIYTNHIATLNKVLLVFGGDTFNYDGIHGGTTKGTPQENILGFKQMVHSFVKDFKSVVDFITKRYELDIIMIPGNHDHNTSITMATLLEQMYSDCNNLVRVNKAIGNKSYSESLSGTRAYYLRGKVLLQIHHGDIDIKRVTNSIKHECKSFYVNANKIFSDYGHLHHKKVKSDNYIGFNKGEVVEYDGVVFRQRGSLSISDGYHDRNAYIGGDDYLIGEVIDDKKGITDILYSE